VFAEAVLELLERVDARLGRPGTLDLVDLGAGGGELAGAVVALAGPRLRRRLRAHAVDLGPRPSGVDDSVRWAARVPQAVTGLLVAHEWLDALPCPVVRREDLGAGLGAGVLRRLGVDAGGGTVELGAAGPRLEAWLRRWWPVPPGASAEVGRPRERAWAAAVRRVRAGAALAVDYGHLRADRAAGRYPAGTLAGYRDGRQVRPVADGGCDLTAHVALDACAAAGRRPWVLASQADALTALGHGAPGVGPGVRAGDPLGWLRAAATTTATAGLWSPQVAGRFGWLLHGVRIPVGGLLGPLPPWQP
jgi:SAM-dependent MidA family methyltransferase